ncbi:hypothetical protein Nham_0134 [Nitrobacter hamburgensis X14]|uniref:Uncharacterized protein n=1 Tax=Nitrobacter hamburgensis (strain DSM 10229 / NCIMB 13809 / X14) TaxID=323097 RepID=Q1QRW2_NITHX|nr:hypothetical protein [Nitrobacter hamburgensis]ABE61035.1 hypothetical protein Nham_0134 [Nitrobacter hamburgensis X14]
MTVAPHILRRYVIDRASGRSQRHEWAFYAPDIDAWIRTDETSARRHEHHKRIRVDGRPWCDVLGHRADVRDDEALQIFFMTMIDPEDWHRLEIAVRNRPKRCLREWRASGKRIMAAVAPETAAPVPDTLGPLDGWPSERGSGQRSLLPR